MPRNQRSSCQYLLDQRKIKRMPEKYLLLLHWLRQSFWLCGSQQTVENSSRERNTWPPYLPPEKPVCRSRSKLEPELKTGKGICQGWILSFCLFYAEYLMKNVRPDDHKLESRLPVEILTTSDSILMAESKEELISLLKTVKEESTEASFKLNIQKTKIVTSSPTVP